MKQITTFPQRLEFEKARAHLDVLDLPHEVLSPGPGYGRVGEPCLVIEPSARMELAGVAQERFTASGWVDYRPARAAVPAVHQLRSLRRAHLHGLRRQSVEW